MNLKRERRSLRDNPEAVSVLERLRSIAAGEKVVDAGVGPKMAAPLNIQVQAADLYLRHVADAGPEAPEELPDHELAAKVVAQYMDDPRVMEAVERLRGERH